MEKCVRKRGELAQSRLRHNTGFILETRCFDSVEMPSVCVKRLEAV